MDFRMQFRMEFQFQSFRFGYACDKFLQESSHVFVTCCLSLEFAFPGKAAKFLAGLLVERDGRLGARAPPFSGARARVRARSRGMVST